MDNSEALYKAADRIEARGWFSMYHGGLGDCVVNTIARVAGHGHPAQSALVAHLGADGLPDVFDWNDAPERTQSEVIEALRAAALITASREQQDAAEATYAENLAVSA